jgi:hypothetical protein
VPIAPPIKPRRPPPLLFFLSSFSKFAICC